MPYIRLRSAYQPDDVILVNTDEVALYVRIQDAGHTNLTSKGGRIILATVLEDIGEIETKINDAIQNEARLKAITIREEMPHAILEGEAD